eukprot:m.13612 g.13612  ORF g.13612 m.13612 type:complete len:330 (-) comp3315_c0_seq1:59-1048(-)
MAEEDPWARVSQMSVSQLKQVIQAAGMELRDCVEKGDLVRRAHEAIQRRVIETPTVSPAAAAAAAATAPPSAHTASPAAPGPLQTQRVTFGEYEALVKAPSSVLEGTQAAQQVVVCLHGFGASCDNVADLTLALHTGDLAARHIAYVFPQAPYGSAGVPEWWRLEMQRWLFALMNGQLAALIREIPPGLPDARRRLTEMLRAVSMQFQCPMKRFVLAGFSQGAMTAMDLQLHLAPDERPARLLVLSGAPICVEEWAKQLQAGHGEGFKMLVTHGRADMVLPYNCSQWILELFRNYKVDVAHVPHASGHEIGGPAVLNEIRSYIESAPTE